MPTLKRRTYRPKKEHKELGYKKSREWSEFYQSRAWSLLREWKRQQNPICEICEREGKITPMNDVHHIVPFRQGKTKDDKWKLFLDADNLVSLCTEHHKKIHNYLNMNQLSFITLDSFIEYDLKSNYDKL